mmetsp:Transcript_120028/g.383189  ORF Transcript_120028/g.383189 Transcript_120028/m.383189 type:complete len:191 (+) Transcript_120028:147-719(+)
MPGHQVQAKAIRATVRVEGGLEVLTTLADIVASSALKDILEGGQRLRLLRSRVRMVAPCSCEVALSELLVRSAMARPPMAFVAGRRFRATLALRRHRTYYCSARSDADLVNSGVAPFEFVQKILLQARAAADLDVRSIRRKAPGRVPMMHQGSICAQEVSVIVTRSEIGIGRGESEAEHLAGEHRAFTFV